ncbi:MAG TPA: 50S ribosomal protein L6 [Candidatus Paceibacterota bacterium]
MSRIGKKPIEIPAGVLVKIDGQRVSVQGPKGELSRDFRPEVSLEQKESTFIVGLRSDSKLGRSLWGLTRTLISNMIQGVTQGYEKRLEIEGVGYRAELQGDSLKLSLGFSHPVQMKTPEHMAVALDKNTIIITGIDKEQVGQFAAKIRKVRPPEPYKGKGIHYMGEVIRRKLGKKAATSGAAK